MPANFRQIDDSLVSVSGLDKSDVRSNSCSTTSLLILSLFVDRHPMFNIRTILRVFYALARLAGKANAVMSSSVRECCQKMSPRIARKPSFYPRLAFAETCLLKM